MNTLHNILYFNSPGNFDNWEQLCQPIGNGYLGMSFFGGISKEKIVLNEKTLWVGGPSENNPTYNGGNKTDRYQYVKKVQELLYDNKYNEAVEIIQELTGLGYGSGAYQLLADLYLSFSNINEENVTNYSRAIDMDNAVYECAFDYEGARHTRTAFANYPSNTICIKLRSDKPRRICVKLSLDKTQSENAVRTDENGTLIYEGKLAENNMRYAAQFRLEKTGGELICAKDSVMVEHADEVVIFFTAATDYAPVYPKYRSGKNPMLTVANTLDAAQEKGYDKLLSEHIADYTELFSRVKLSLNNVSGEPEAVDVLIEKYKTAKDRTVLSTLESLYFQFGRYMLIGSSRAGSLPANLQGVWNESNMPPWCCDYHINVNLQMNYWGAYNTNLVETVPPLVDFLDAMREPGRITAKEYYNIESNEENPENGWIAHTTTTPFGWTAPGWDFYWGWSTSAVAWLMQNIWEHYEFTEDKDYLREKIYPIMKESVKFYRQWLIYDDKQERLVSTPTYSPEHGPVTVGNTYEQSLIEQLYRDFIKASEALDADAELREQIKRDVELLKPYHIGKTGLLKEWFEEDEPDFDHTKTQPNHRHISHLLGLYPGKGITEKTPELMKAAINTMNDRGDESTGWARAYKLNLWARTGDADRAYSILHGLLASCTFPNMFDFHPPFQLDGNFGGSAGIAEMLLQSHNGYICPLASLPTAWADGAFSGLCARGGFTVSAEWEGSEAKSISVLSVNGNDCTVKLAKKPTKAVINGADAKFSEKEGIYTFPMNKGQTLELTF